MNLEFIVKVANSLDAQKTADYTWAANAIDMALASAYDAGAGDSDAMYQAALEHIRHFANILDVDGHHKVADLLDQIMSKTAEAQKDYSNLYDSADHRQKTLFQALEDGANAATEPEFESWKGGGHPLLTRYSPDYPGVMMQRISDGVYQDLLSKKVYDFRNGFISDTGVRYYGGSVANQTPNAMDWQSTPQIMESRNLRVRPR